AHAAVAIDNARLLAETRAALEELSAANKVISTHSDAVERAAEAHDRMAELVLRGGDVGDLAAVVAEVLGARLTVLDAEGRHLAGNPPPDGAAEAVAAARGLGRTTRRGELWVTAVDAGGENLCALVLHSPADLAEADQRILERAGVVTALLVL